MGEEACLQTSFQRRWKHMPFLISLRPHVEIEKPSEGRQSLTQRIFLNSTETQEIRGTACPELPKKTQEDSGF